MVQSVRADSGSLARECSVLSRYLVSLPADEGLVEAYASFHRRKRVDGGFPFGPFDRCSLVLLRSGPLGARFVDAYVSRFRRGGPAFERLVVMLALIECRPQGADLLARPDPGGVASVVVRLAFRGLADVLMLAIAVGILGPLHLLQRLGTRQSPR